MPSSFLKSTLEEVWDKEYEILHETCLDKFRSKRNVNQWVFKYWNLASGNFYPRSADFGRCFHLKDKLSDGLKEAIENKSFHMVCINDTANTTNFEKHKDMVNTSFEKVLHEKSRFEK